MSRITLKQGESRELVLTVTTTGGTIVDLTGATLLLGVKRRKQDTTYAFSHTHGDFSLTLATIGVVSVFLTTANTIQYQGDLIGELRIKFATSPVIVDKSADFTISIQEAVIKY